MKLEVPVEKPEGLLLGTAMGRGLPPAMGGSELGAPGSGLGLGTAIP